MNPNVLKSLLVSLSTTGTRFILVGGLAVELCGYHRATYDVDLLIDHDEVNLQSFLDILSQIGEGFAKELTPQDFDLSEGCITVNEEELQVDIFTIMSGYTYKDLLPFTSKHLLNDGYSMLHLNIEGLLLLKSKSVRPKDQNDVFYLRELQADSKRL